jgi:multiple sugar transport system substrate-binding protein/sn-glycerol 3-phosphate transport system substrate-binding protein
MNMRRLLFVLVAAGVLLALVTSCAQPTPEPTEEVPPEAPAEEPTEAPPPTEEPTEVPEPTPVPLDYDVEIYGDLENLDPSGQTVVYWYQHTGSREELMLSLIDEFNRTNEWGITVQGESQGGYTDLYQKIVAGIPANQLPTMAVAYQNQAATYAVQGVLVAFDPYMESEKWGYTEEELDDFFPIALAADYLPQFEARYGFPPYKSMEVMYYNEDWLAELGYDGPPETWEEFGEMACTATEQPFSGATGEGASYGYVYSIDASRFATFTFSRGGNIINETGTGYVFNGSPGLGPGGADLPEGPGGSGLRRGADGAVRRPERLRRGPVAVHHQLHLRPVLLRAGGGRGGGLQLERQSATAHHGRATAEHLRR